jgi:hypothetical protein
MVNAANQFILAEGVEEGDFFWREWLITSGSSVHTEQYT